MLRPRAQMAIENVGLFQYQMCMIKTFRKTKYVFKGIFSDSKSHVMIHAQENFTFKISLDSNFLFSCYALLYAYHCSHRLLC